MVLQGPARTKTDLRAGMTLYSRNWGLGKPEPRLKLHHYYALRGCLNSTLTDSMLILETQSQV